VVPRRVSANHETFTRGDQKFAGLRYPRLAPLVSIRPFVHQENIWARFKESLNRCEVIFFAAPI
jgi:hypothetical protein